MMSLIVSTERMAKKIAMATHEDQYVIVPDDGSKSSVQIQPAHLAVPKGWMVHSTMVGCIDLLGMI